MRAFARPKKTAFLRSLVFCLFLGTLQECHVENVNGQVQQPVGDHNTVFQSSEACSLMFLDHFSPQTLSLAGDQNSKWHLSLAVPSIISSPLAAMNHTWMAL